MASAKEECRILNKLSEETILSVQQIVSAASNIYNDGQHAENITFEQPDTYNRFSDTLQQKVASWLQQKKNAAF